MMMRLALGHKFLHDFLSGAWQRHLLIFMSFRLKGNAELNGTNTCHRTRVVLCMSTCHTRPMCPNPAAKPLGVSKRHWSGKTPSQGYAVRYPTLTVNNLMHVKYCMC